MQSSLNYQPQQILCLEQEGAYLYAEVIQVTDRGSCWVRPLALSLPAAPADTDRAAPESSLEPVLYDLRQGADLLCPTLLFRPALDTEVIPILMQLDAQKQPIAAPEAITSEISQQAHQQLQQFIQRVWQTKPEVFQR